MHHLGEPDETPPMAVHIYVDDSKVSGSGVGAATAAFIENTHRTF